MVVGYSIKIDKCTSIRHKGAGDKDIEWLPNMKVIGKSLSGYDKLTLYIYIYIYIYIYLVMSRTADLLVTCEVRGPGGAFKKKDFCSKT